MPSPMAKSVLLLAATGCELESSWGWCCPRPWCPRSATCCSIPCNPQWQRRAWCTKSRSSWINDWRRAAQADADSCLGLSNLLIMVGATKLKIIKSLFCDFGEKIAISASEANMVEDQKIALLQS